MRIVQLGRAVGVHFVLYTQRPSGLKLDYIQRNSLPTSRVLVTTDEQGVPQYEIVENVAWDAIECNEAILELASQADVISWGSLAQSSEM